MSSHRARADEYYSQNRERYFDDPRDYRSPYPEYRERSPLRRQIEFREEYSPRDRDSYYRSPSDLRRYRRPTEDVDRSYHAHRQDYIHDRRYEDEEHYDEEANYADRTRDDKYNVVDEWAQEEEASERGRPWLPPRDPGSPQPGPSRESDPVIPAGADQTSTGQPYVVPDTICKELTSLLVDGISTEQSKAGSKDFPLLFEDKDFSLKPPKLDNWLSRRAKDKGVLRTVNSSEETLTKIQLKIMDIGQPLIAFYSRIQALLNSENPQVELPTPMEDLSKALKVSLEQWGRAFAFITKLRRDAVVGLVDPKFSYLLKEDGALPEGKEARELLLSKSFIELMLKEAQTDEILSRSDKAVAARKRTANYRGNGSGSRGSHGHQPNPSPQHQPTTQREPVADRGGHAGRGAQRGSQGPTRYNLPVDNTSYSLPHPCFQTETVVGARILEFSANWAAVTRDSWVLETVNNGLLIDFVSKPIQRRLPNSVTMSDDMKKICDDEVDSLASKGAITEVLDSSVGFVCSFFCIPKKDSTWRPIVNLKPLNMFIRYEHFKMEGLDSVKFLVRQGDWLVKIDLKDAYLTVPIHPSQRKFLRFSWRKRIFQFRCLPFGLSAAPRVFTKLLKVVVAFLREKGIRLVIYLDDILLLNQSQKKVKAEAMAAIDLLNSLGFLINYDKSVITPSQKMEYLGLVIDSKALTFALPDKKVEKVVLMCTDALKDGFISLRRIASILGNFTWAIPTIPFAQSHYRSMQSFYIKQSKKAQGDLNNRCELSPESCDDLRWWISNLNEVNGKCFSARNPDLEIYSDASLSGWGAVCNEVTTRGPWTSADASRHINELELLGAFFALKSFVGVATGLSVKMFLDNTTAVAYVNHSGGTKSAKLTDIAMRLTSFCEAQRIDVVAVHLAGIKNKVADRESRAVADASDYQLNPIVGQDIFRVWPCTVDLFSSSWNAQLPKFVTWRPQPGAMAVNAFSLCWGSIDGFISPPFSVILRCLEKVRRDSANVVLVCPAWTTQPWFPVLLEMACDTPYLLPQLPDILVSPMKEPHPLIQANAINLVAWRLSGIVSKCKAFRDRWSNCYWPVIDQTQRQLMDRRGIAGAIGVLDGVSIPCRLL